MGFADDDVAVDNGEPLAGRSRASMVPALYPEVVVFCCCLLQTHNLNIADTTLTRASVESEKERMSRDASSSTRLPTLTLATTTNTITTRLLSYDAACVCMRARRLLFSLRSLACVRATHIQ